MAATRLVLATRNASKLVELDRILREATEGSPVSVQLVGLADLPEFPEAPETGATFAANALAKARDAAAATGLPAVADDSGLCVDALNGMPGVLSARWCGRHGDDVANLELLLGQIADVPDDRRGAFFACAAALALPDGRERVVTGELAGRVTRAPRGSNGFGYDPIFEPILEPSSQPDGRPRTTAELSAAEKDAISHRGRAFRALVPHIVELVAGGPPAPVGAVPARVSFVTLGCRDWAGQRAFYERLGWPVVAAADDFVAFDTGGAVLGLFPRASLAADASVPDDADFGGVTLAVNVELPDLVAEALDGATRAGATLLKPATSADWGGVSGYFRDPEGNLWEVAHVPGSTFDGRGGLVFPRG